VPFGEGVRCVGGSIFRLRPPVVTDATGAASLQVDFTQGAPSSGSGAILPGSTWYFQFWHRDKAAGGSGFNLSNGLKTTFHP